VLINKGNGIMFSPIIEMLERKILNYFSCQYNPNPKRLKIFWYYILSLILVALICAIGIFILVNYNINAMLVIGLILIALALFLNMINKPSTKTKERIKQWWHGESKWWHLFF